MIASGNYHHSTINTQTAQVAARKPATANLALFRPAAEEAMEVISGGGASLGDMVVGFLEEEVGSGVSTESCGAGDIHVGDVCADQEEEVEDDAGSAAERLAFWKSQHQLLKTTLYRSTSLEARIREEAEAAMRESRSAGQVCSCRRPVAPGCGYGCRCCLLRDVVERLRTAGYDAAVCRSKWRSTPDIPAGEHVYADVVDTRGKNPVRVVIEPDFRGEFEMGRASQEYSRLICRLPQLYVGKAERLKAVIKMLCGAAKQCAKESKMHIGPWRRHKYMQAKWFGAYMRTGPVNLPAAKAREERQRPKVTVSMLTSDLLERLPALQCPAVAVV